MASATSLAPLAASVACLALAGCSPVAATPLAAASPTADACAPLSPRPGPGVAAVLTETESGEILCLRVGDQVNVFLRSPPRQDLRFWKPISNAGPDVLTAVPNGVGAALRGVTSASFRARGPGRITLASTRYPCSPPEDKCFATDRWSVTVVVAGS